MLPFSEVLCIATTPLPSVLVGLVVGASVVFITLAGAAYYLSLRHVPILRLCYYVPAVLALTLLLRVTLGTESSCDEILSAISRDLVHWSDNLNPADDSNALMLRAGAIRLGLPPRSAHIALLLVLSVTPLLICRATITRRSPPGLRYAFASLVLIAGLSCAGQAAIDGKLEFSMLPLIAAAAGAFFRHSVGAAMSEFACVVYVVRGSLEAVARFAEPGSLALSPTLLAVADIISWIGWVCAAVLLVRRYARLIAQICARGLFTALAASAEKSSFVLAVQILCVAAGGPPLYSPLMLPLLWALDADASPAVLWRDYRVSSGKSGPPALGIVAPNILAAWGLWDEKLTAEVVESESDGGTSPSGDPLQHGESADSSTGTMSADSRHMKQRRLTPTQQLRVCAGLGCPQTWVRFRWLASASVLFVVTIACISILKAGFVINDHTVSLHANAIALLPTFLVNFSRHLLARFINDVAITLNGIISTFFWAVVSVATQIASWIPVRDAPGTTPSATLLLQEAPSAHFFEQHVTLAFIRASLLGIAALLLCFRWPHHGVLHAVARCCCSRFTKSAFSRGRSTAMESSFIASGLRWSVYLLLRVGIAAAIALWLSVTLAAMPWSRASSVMLTTPMPLNIEEIQVLSMCALIAAVLLSEMLPLRRRDVLNALGPFGLFAAGFARASAGACVIALSIAATAPVSFLPCAQPDCVGFDYDDVVRKLQPACLLNQSTCGFPQSVFVIAALGGWLWQSCLLSETAALRWWPQWGRSWSTRDGVRSTRTAINSGLVRTVRHRKSVCHTASETATTAESLSNRLRNDSAPPCPSPRRTASTQGVVDCAPSPPQVPTTQLILDLEQAPRLRAFKTGGQIDRSQRPISLFLRLRRFRSEGAASRRSLAFVGSDRVADKEVLNMATVE